MEDHQDPILAPRNWNKRTLKKTLRLNIHNRPATKPWFLCLVYLEGLWSGVCLCVRTIAAFSFIRKKNKKKSSDQHPAEGTLTWRRCSRSSRPSVKAWRSSASSSSSSQPFHLSKWTGCLSVAQAGGRSPEEEPWVYARQHGGVFSALSAASIYS